MTDRDWEAWQSTWTGTTGPLPDVRARAGRERRLDGLGRAGFFLLVAIGLAASVPAFTAPEPEVHWMGFVIVAFCGAMGAGYLWIQRGAEGPATSAPRDALAFLERRLRVERQAAQLVRWVYAGLCAAFVVIFPGLVAGHSDPWLEMAIAFPSMAVTLVATFSAPWWVARRNRRYEGELAAWRRWLDEQQL
jgi:hypothetical protein